MTIIRSVGRGGASWPAWKNDFGADADIVGKSVRLNKHPYTIVGVTPEGFYGSEKFLHPDIFVPMANQASLNGWTGWSSGAPRVSLRSCASRTA